MPGRALPRKSPALAFAKDKSLTVRRTRSALMIDAFLVRSEPMIVQLMTVDEATMRRVCEPWQHAPNIDSSQFKPPIIVGQHALLAFPGTLIESIDEDASSRARTRILIKAADQGVIFNLIGWLTLGRIEWDWRSMEYASENIRDECIRRLMDRIKSLVRVEIPTILANVEELHKVAGQ